ncbi:hypothetical protein HGRIS_003007 [Hohenbuehelia grisea]|uniref:Uncharacterized protein n=1 Tax=Hohenbuehelia grisea TaxID=104357 RepID=A0ABR3JN11_9AGAR
MAIQSTSSLPIAYANEKRAAAFYSQAETFATSAHLPRRRLLTFSLAALALLFSASSYLVFFHGRACNAASTTPISYPPLHRAHIVRPHHGRIAAIVPHRFEFTPEQEVAAVTSFVTALQTNALPLSIDPSTSVDPQLVLEFDVHNTRELEAMEKDVWVRHPVVLYAKQSAASVTVKSTLSALQLTPPPTFIDVDERNDAPILSTVISRLTGAEDLPALLIGGKYVSIADLPDLQTSGELALLLLDAGAVVGGARKVPVKHRKQVQIRRQGDHVVQTGKQELTHEDLVFRGLISI